ncbi:stage VI sporulation protein D [Neobacillus sp. D3-1R]|uniref:stage VI sporulation protein D n=1 Tax=Neobacillus sp. D3-1R TaxID=3445778 RepID=UPI003FA05FD3
MSQGNQSSLRFSLEESVWFQRGQEVEELVSISLDPNITIQESEQYVMIRGSLDLTGEYKRQSGTTEEEEQWSSVQKWVQNVEEREEGLCEFSHQFPVDITIPTTRVRDLSEIDVLIDTFDYVLPEKSCLKLTAELNIFGLYGEQETTEERAEEEEELVELNIRNLSEVDVEEDDTEDELEYEPFEVEARKEEKFFTDPVLVESSSHLPQAPEISFAAYRSEKASEVPEPEVQAEVEEMQVKVEMVEVVESSESSSSVVEAPVKKKLTNKKSMSIAEFLARKESEDDLAKLKVCIVQHGDTIDQLAERYQVNVQQLLKVNHLELNQDVHEGQVLYIPQVYVRK